MRMPEKRPQGSKAESVATAAKVLDLAYRSSISGGCSPMASHMLRTRVS
jgi:hypothetical protein